MNKPKEKKKNVLFLVSNIKVGGGAERVAAKVANAFSKKKSLNSQLLTFYDFYEKTYDYEGEYHTLGETPKKTFFGKVWKALTQRLWGVYRHCVNNNIDTLVAFLPEAGVYAILANFLPGNNARVVVSVRNNPRQRSRIYKMVYRYLYPFADVVVAVSKGV
jgi:hypothetical protein